VKSSDWAQEAESEFLKTENGYLIKAATGSITALKGILSKPRKPVSVAMMDEAVRRRARR